MTNNNQKAYKEYTVNSNSLSNSNFVYECSANIVHSSERNPFFYLCKYFNIEYTEKNLEIVQNILTLTYYKNELCDNCLLTYFEKDLIDKLKYTVSYMFLYKSPQKNINKACEIELTSTNIKGLIAHIQAKIEHKQSKEQQRSLMTNELRTAIKERDNYTCCNCGNSTLNEPNLLLEVDHIVPISKGGQTEYYNLQTLCWKCNRSKSDKIY